MKSIILFFATLPLYGAVTCSPSCVDVSIPTPTGTVTATYARPKLVYTITGLTDALYRVDLLLMEWVAGYDAPGKRPLSVTINGSPVLKGFSPGATIGLLKLVTISFTKQPTAGTLVVVISNDLGNSAISAGVQWFLDAPSQPSTPQPTTVQPLGCTPTRKDARTLSVSGCNIKVNRITHWIPPIEVNVTDGIGVIRGGIDTSVSPPATSIHAAPGVVATCTGNCHVDGQPQFDPAKDLQLFTWSVTSGMFDTNGFTDLHAIESVTRYDFTAMDCVQAGTTIRCTPSVGSSTANQ